MFFVDRRKEPRIATDEPVRVKVLGEFGWQMPGTALDLSGRGMLIRAEKPVPLGSAVRIDLEDALVLGEVCHCIRTENGYHVGLMLVESLLGLRDLARLNANLLREEVVTRPAHRVATAV